MNDDVLLADAVTTAIRHIGIGTYSSGKIYTYLQQKGYPSAVCRLAVIEVTNRGYIDDFKAANKVIRSRTGNKQESKYYLAQRLKNAGINSTIIDSVISEIDNDTVTCIRLFDSSFLTNNSDDSYALYSDAMKLASKRGYTLEVASNAFSIWLKNK